MRFPADNDVWKKTVDLVRAWGHDVVTAREASLSDSPDRDLLSKAETEDRILIPGTAISEHSFSLEKSLKKTSFSSE